jgi:DNA modification methylase
VLDPFAGAGTSLLVAHKMGYDWIGIELVPKYVGIINKRIERHGKFRLDAFMPQEAKVALN